MAETEGRKAQDIGQDEAYVVDLKEVVAAERESSGRNRILFDALACNMVTSVSAINSQIVRSVEQGMTTSGKNAENTIGINETDHLVAQVLNSPWAEAMKTLLGQIIAAATKESESKK